MWCSENSADLAFLFVLFIVKEWDLLLYRTAAFKPKLRSLLIRILGYVELTPQFYQCEGLVLPQSAPAFAMVMFLIVLHIHIVIVCRMVIVVLVVRCWHLPLYAFFAVDCP